METPKKKTGRPVGSRDRNNIFLGEKSTEIILKGLVNLRKDTEVQQDEEFEKVFTLISSHAINLFGSTQYLEIVGN